MCKNEDIQLKLWSTQNIMYSSACEIRIQLRQMEAFTAFQGNTYIYEAGITIITFQTC